MHNSQHWIQTLQLEPHPEGGFYRRIYQSTQTVQTASGKRPCATAIHYLLESHDFSAWHKIKSDETWFHHAGAPIIIRTLDSKGVLNEYVLGQHMLSLTVNADTWFCAQIHTDDENTYTLCSCMVSPGFDFADFEMGTAANLIKQYPEHKNILSQLCRK
ncbi:hypothetical protein NBRC116188_25660 [Oceaniserpentilla sp. 4NH20-0058]|uniref:cupin domain-containing protein n=1 Tax=Oceaniserpentilla sp. 4NH20-0058 TaxID=3127660 RepID=UPI003102E729